MMGEKLLFIQNEGSDFSQTRGKHDYEKGQRGSVSKNQWRMEKGINTQPQPMTLTQVARPNKCQDQLSTSHPNAKIQTSSLTAI